MAPPEATKDTHAGIRQVCKTIVLGVQYGMKAEGLAARTGLHIVEAREILLRHVLCEGRVCGVDVATVTYPDRYSDKRGKVMWDRVMALVDKEERANGQELDAA